MQILISGYHNPHFITVTEYIERAVRALGHEVIAFNDRDHLFPGRLRRKMNLLQKISVEAISRRLHRLALKLWPDAVLITGGHRITRRALKGLPGRKMPTVLWTTDPPQPCDIMLTTAPYYHYIFCQGSEYIDIFRQQGIKSAQWLPIACDPQIHSRVDMTAADQRKLGNDVVFVGSYYPNRAESLEQLSTFNLGVWGPGWEVLPLGSPLQPFIRAAHTTPATWVRIYSASKIVLSIHYRDPHRRLPVHQASPRVFEAMACGAFGLTDRQKDVLSMFKDGEHLAVFDDAVDLKQKVSYFLAHPAERNRIAACGRREVLKKHTYTHRIETLLKAVDLPPQHHSRCPRNSADDL
jgi:spore maturation protein CgeB